MESLYLYGTWNVSSRKKFNCVHDFCVNLIIHALKFLISAANLIVCTHEILI